MIRAAKPKPGDWVSLAMYRKVSGVDRSTPREEAKARLLDHLIEGLLDEREPPPGWTEAEFRAYQHQHD